jgi:methylmalonyl-CoA/ethylmalonyl-CoA epimerase
MKVQRIDHIGIAVRNLEESLAQWTNLFAIESSGIEEVREREVRLAHLKLEQGPTVELVSPLGERAPVEKFLKERGEGIHHFCFKVEDIQKTMQELKAKGIQFVQEKPYKGAGGSLIAFIHPSSINGVLIELKE